VEVNNALSRRDFRDGAKSDILSCSVFFENAMKHV